MRGYSQQPFYTSFLISSFCVHPEWLRVREKWSRSQMCLHWRRVHQWHASCVIAISSADDSRWHRCTSALRFASNLLQHLQYLSNINGFGVVLSLPELKALMAVWENSIGRKGYSWKCYMVTLQPIITDIFWWESNSKLTNGVLLWV